MRRGMGQAETPLERTARQVQLGALLREARRRTDPKVLAERSAQVGRPIEAETRRRRGEGCSQDDVAFVLGMSQQHYARLERGELRLVEPWRLDLLAHVLGLDGARHRLLFDLVNGHPGTAIEPASADERAAAHHWLEVLDPVPAAVTDCGWNPLEVNPGFERWCGTLDSVPKEAVNFVYFAFTDLAESFGAYQDLERERRELIGRVLAAWPRHGRCQAFKTLIERLKANPIAAPMLAEGEAREPSPALLNFYRLLPYPDPVEVATLNLELPGNLRLIVSKPAAQRTELP